MNIKTISLPDGLPAPAVVIELPEHAWARPRGANEPQRFYRLYSNEAQYGGRTNWEKTGSTLKYTMTLPVGILIRVSKNRSRNSM